MAVTLEGSIKRFIGLSTDEKPRPGSFLADGTELTESDIPAGSSFLASDTGAVYRWNGIDWLAADSAEVLELRALRGAIADLVAELQRNSF